MKPPCVDCGEVKAYRLAHRRCSACYKRYCLTPDFVPSPRRKRSLDERLAWYEVSEQGCYIYQGRVTRYGYAQTADGRLHRLAYERANGSIPDGFDVDHTCHNRDRGCPGGDNDCLHRRCINPAHLEAVPPIVNRRRAPNNFATINRLKTHCIHGHEFTPDNVLPRHDGYRECRTCSREYKRAWALRRKQAA